MQKDILPAVAAFILNDRKEILLQQRKDTGKWCIISGHVDFGETVQEAMVREIQEELNVSAEVVRLIGVYSTPQYATYYYHGREVQYVVTYFEVKLFDEIQKDLSNNETLDVNYFTPANLPNDFDLINPNWLTDAMDPHQRVFIR